MWHLQHDAIVMENYIIPVPTNWYAQILENGDQLLIRVDTDDKSPATQPHVHAKLFVHWSPTPLSDEEVRDIASLDAAHLEQRGVNPVLWGMNANDATITCVGPDELGSGGGHDVEPISSHCVGSNGLNISITATKADMQQVREILSGIRKKP